MLDKDIDRARDYIHENLDLIIGQLESCDRHATETMTEIYNICNEADANNWNACFEKIQEIAREFI